MMAAALFVMGLILEMVIEMTFPRYRRQGWIGKRRPEPKATEQ